jgi:hypothetical protein
MFYHDPGRRRSEARSPRRTSGKCYRILAGYVEQDRE